METCTYVLGEDNRKPTAEMPQGADCLSHLEQVYENGLVREFECLGIPVERQKRYPVFYRESQIGEYFADVVVNGRVILEVKSVKALNSNMEAQLINYLKISGLRVGYLVNFKNARVEYRRFVV